MGRPKCSWIKVAGRVWFLGSKRYLDKDFGGYWQFVLKVPSVSGTKLWVQWFKPTFEPMPKDFLEIDGVLSHTYIQERMNKPPKLNVVLQVFGPELTRKGEQHAIQKQGPASLG